MSTEEKLQRYAYGLAHEIAKAPKHGGGRRNRTYLINLFIKKLHDEIHLIDKDRADNGVT